MTSIEQIIQREVNPFDSTTFRPGNFWREESSIEQMVNSIHQEAISEVQSVLDFVAADSRTRTILLSGDSGTGKSYLLGRLKSTLNSRAFFAYIGPWPDRQFIWRHTLRNTVDSLMYVPVHQTESQLLLWLKKLSAFRETGLKKQILGERNLFIHNFKGTYPSGIFNPNEFFSILYALTQPDLYPLACDWLKGDDLDEESLQLLNVKQPIDSEMKAQNILANFGRISVATQPIVLCFDNLDNVDRSEEGAIDLQSLFNINSIIHNQKSKNFLVIISIITNTWNQNNKQIQPADKARIDTQIRLRPIDLDRAQKLWASRMYPLHCQADAPPHSAIYPLDRAALEEKFPGGKALPRQVLMLGRQLFQTAKNEGISAQKDATLQLSSEPDRMAAFHLLWLKEFAKMEMKVTQIRNFSGPELIHMLREALSILEIAKLQPKLLPSKTYASYSLSYHLPLKPGQIGLIWTEEPNLVSFCHVMKVCQNALKQKLCTSLQLIRAERLGVPRNQGYQAYQKLFDRTEHLHVIPDLKSIHYLATYSSVVKAARAEELVLGDRTLSLTDLIALVRQSGLLQQCLLLQKLGVFWQETERSQPLSSQQQLPEFILALVKTQQLIGRQILLDRSRDRFPELSPEQIDLAIETLCQEQAIQILDPRVNPEEQLVAIVRKLTVQSKR